MYTYEMNLNLGHHFITLYLTLKISEKIELVIVILLTKGKTFHVFCQSFLQAIYVKYCFEYYYFKGIIQLKDWCPKLKFIITGLKSLKIIISYALRRR